MRALVLSLLCLLPAGRSQAATAWGTIITNVATITMTSGFPDFVAYEVSYNMTCAVMVMSPGTMLISKTVSPTSTGAGGTLTYCITVVNDHPLDSAFNIHVEDIIPGASGVMAYLQGQDNWIDGTAGATLSLSYGSGRAPWNAFYTNYPGECPTGQTGPYAIRWVISLMGPGKSAMLCWKARVL